MIKNDIFVYFTGKILFIATLALKMARSMYIVVGADAGSGITCLSLRSDDPAYRKAALPLIVFTAGESQNPKRNGY
jgi:hypothetical protein